LKNAFLTVFTHHSSVFAHVLRDLGVRTETNPFRMVRARKIFSAAKNFRKTFLKIFFGDQKIFRPKIFSKIEKIFKNFSGQKWASSVRF